MRDYTSNNYCDFLWINDLLQLKKNSKNVYTTTVKNTQVTFNNVIIFGTVVEVKQIAANGYLYQIDDGTGVIACKHSTEQFEEVISVIENELTDSFNDTLGFQQSMEQSVLTDMSADDSIFNDKSMQSDEISINKKSRLKGVQSIWDDIFKSFQSLIEQYNIGDTVMIEGRLYNYFNMNQIYINSIRTIDVAEEIMLLNLKLEGEPDANENQRAQPDTEKRFSGLVTFDNIQNLNPKFSVPKNIDVAVKDDILNEKPEVVVPNLDTTITFDTFSSQM